MKISELADRALRLVPSQHGSAPQTTTPLPGLALLRNHRPTAFEAAIYQPVVCLILQGAKETTMGDRTFGARAGDALLVSHDLPVIARITKAPYLALLLDVNMATLRSVYDELAELAPEAAPARAMEVHQADARLVEALGRYLALVRSPTDTKVLGPLLAREVHYHLLMAPFGGMLRSLIRHDSHASAIARAIARLRQDYRSQLTIPELAREVGMSVSSFHAHFKAVTSSTPLQYQKDLRLLAARRLVRSGELSVTRAAFEVGYESPTQFSREYARKFGTPPSKERSIAG